MIYNTIYYLKTHGYKDIQHAQKNKHQIQDCSYTGGKGKRSRFEAGAFQLHP